MVEENGWTNGKKQSSSISQHPRCVYVVQFWRKKTQIVPFKDLNSFSFHYLLQHELWTPKWREKGNLFPPGGWRKCWQTNDFGPRQTRLRARHFRFWRNGRIQAVKWCTPEKKSPKLLLVKFLKTPKKSKKNTKKMILSRFSLFILSLFTSMKEIETHFHLEWVGERRRGGKKIISYPPKFLGLTFGCRSES